ncbi:gliding motility-associated C-terminal domain-containing protein [Mucilaginibacter mali]|uniref:Gliding motility-associated C-terminal domain-containing protein n=1 Tax=Mucilaginibacter mali TaxID=2740462 RepID=A0A7D4Q1K2_9SPHI|nr:gliding motility-associated C-terminal domain-containing protein [Mucilaginibacter mali]QKJ28987.1 gliding motility-associated C-terminal domain-containing protein [Mucilaginibacter mali]
MFFIAGRCYAQEIVITPTSYPVAGGSETFSGRLFYTMPPEIDTCMKVIPVIINGNYYIDSLVITGSCVKYTGDKLLILSRGTFNFEIYWRGRLDVKKTIEVGPRPAPVISSIIALPNFGCEGETVTYMADVPAAHDKALYQWQINGANAGVNSAAYTGILKSGDKLKLKVTNFDLCTTSADSMTVTVPVLKPSALHTVTVSASENPLCGAHPVTYTASSSRSSPGMVYQWQLNGQDAGDNKSTYTLNNPHDGDRVSCTIGDLSNCVLPVSSPLLIVSVSEVPTVKFAGNLTTNYGGQLQLQPVINGNISKFMWTPAIGLSDATIANPMASPPVSTKYKLTVFNNDGCTAEADILVKVTIMVPNTFTPNGDGVNDTWKIPQLIYYPDCKLKVYNRTGGLVFQSAGYAKSWDGTSNGHPLPAGAYYYVIEVDKTIVSGYITIIR